MDSSSRAVAEQGTFTAAAVSLGYTQSAVSRQMASLERAAGTTLLDRRREGVRLTPAGHLVLRRATTVLDEIDRTARELSGLPDQGGTVRVGRPPNSGAVILPRALTALRASHPAITVTSREGSTPALVRALRSGSIDLALLSSTPPYRPLDAESPSLVTETLTERGLCLALPVSHPLARGAYVDIADLRGQRWIAAPASGEDRLMGVWPGLDERPVIAHTARDRPAKLHLVAVGRGLTTVPASLAPAAPDGVAVRPVRGGAREQRRLLLARLPTPPADAVSRVADALRTASRPTDTAP
ncbi:LysR family transcriptional regulator [Streptomyces sp. NPDC056716]|uniref:LysR family transcriptional regulator n=1 Tax=unclassified Streptomyces TaxID=2593676 RepID=UPI00369E37B0